MVRPLSKGITPQINGQSLAFSITKPCQLSVERSWITGNDQDAEVLFIFANPPETYAPKPDDPNVLYYGPGLHHVDGNITLKSGQTLYLAGGALVEAGGVRAQNAQDIAVRGHGVLTCSVDRIWDSGLEFKNCQKLLLADVIVFTYTPEKYQNGIQNMLNVCFDVTVQNYKAIGSNANTDGFQCHGCSRMTFTDSFIRGTDDNLAFYGDSYGRSGIRETNDISVMRCVFWPTWQSGVCRVGWGDYPNPTSANNIRFRDCDVIHMWRSVGNTYTFNERALIDMREFAGRPPSHYSNILFEDIRMEEIDTLISVYTDESKNVTLRNLMLRNIQVLQPFARTQFKGRPGATIFGCNNFENVLFENITIADKPVLSPEQMDMSLYGVAAAQPGKLCFLDANGVNRCPIASFTTDVRAGVAPLTVLFDASGSSVPHGKLASYTWNFGDGTTGSGIKVNHTYQHNGRYEVLLTVMSEAGVPRTAKLRYLTVTDHGVTGEYFLNRTMMDRAIISIDRTLDLNWGKGLPCVELGETDYAMRWSGQLRPRYNEDYTFTLAAGDQARLWVNKQLLAKTESPGGKEQGTIHLQAGHYYDIKLEYREHGGAGFVKVLWASNSQPEEVIPTACLVPWNSRETALALGTKKMIAQELPLGTGFITKFYTAKPQPAKTESWTRMKQAGYEFVPTRDLTVTALGRAFGRRVEKLTHHSHLARPRSTRNRHHHGMDFLAHGRNGRTL